MRRRTQPDTIETTRLDDHLRTADRLLHHLEQQLATAREVLAAAALLAKSPQASSAPIPPLFVTAIDPAVPALTATPRILRAGEVAAMCGLSRSTIWRLQRAGHFPQRCRIAPGAVGWLREEIQAWLQRVAAERQGGEIARTPR